MKLFKDPNENDSGSNDDFEFVIDDPIIKGDQEIPDIR